MGRYLKLEDFKLTAIILALVGLFLLNACAPRAGIRPAISDSEAPKYQTGKVQGRAVKIPKNEPAMEPEQDGQPGASIIIPEPSSTVEFDEVNVTTDFDTKKVQIKTNAKVGEILEALTIEGEFDDSGIAYARSKTKDNQNNALASVRCIEGCSKILTEIAVKHIDANGEEVIEIQQFTQDNLKSAIPGAPSATDVNSDEEQDEDSSNATDFEEDPGVPGEYVSVLEKSDMEKLVPVALKPGTVITPKPEKPTSDDEKPSRPDNQKQGNYSFDTEIFPLDLKKQKNYSGEAVGFYASCAGKKNCTNGYILNSSNIVFLFQEILKTLTGFLPVDYKDGIHYGSGVLIRLIEAVGSDFSKKFPNEKFLIGDLSKKEGGEIFSIVSGKKKNKHESHRSGLDLDVKRSTSGRTAGENYAKDWELIKMFVSYGVIDVIFFSTENIKNICAHIKKTGDKNYEEVFSKLYPEDKHKTHFHVRVSCTKHNISCQKANYNPKKIPVCN